MTASEPLRKLRYSSFIVGLLSFIWFAYRTGTKPSRASYPCQRAALANSTLMLQFIAVPAVIGAYRKIGRVSLLVLILSSAFALGAYHVFSGTGTATVISSLHLTLDPMTATQSPASDVYAVNDDLGSDSGVSNLVSTMAAHGLDFYSLYAPDDVVLIKVNWQWDQRGGTNTDLLRGLISKILARPGFTGEIVVADNGQGKGSTDWGSLNNAEDVYQSTQDVVDSFAPAKVSTYLWDSIRAVQVSEYSSGDMADGYVLASSPDPLTGIVVSYPKFTTVFGTRISFKHGVWNSSAYLDKLKVISVATLKSHIVYGSTGAVKLYMGVVSESEYNQGGLTASHDTVANGGMGTLMASTRFPVLSIIDAVYINAIPLSGPTTAYDQATRVSVVAASTDPVALDYWSSKYILKQAAVLGGYDPSSLDPDYTGPPVGQYQVEVPGVWLRASMDAMLAVDPSLQITFDESRINVHIYSPLATVLSLDVSPAPSQNPAVYTVSGNLAYLSSGLGVPATRIRFYRTSGINSSLLTTVSTDASGGYSFAWYASVTGRHLIRAVYFSDRPEALGSETERTVIWP